MLNRTFNANSKKTFLIPFVLCLLMVFQQVSTLAGEVMGSKENPIPERILFSKSYYNMKDLERAAEKMRADAKRMGIDEHIIPALPTEYKFFNEGSGKMKITLPTGTFDFDRNDKTRIVEFDREEKEKAVIFVASRPLSIDEVASLMESQIRIHKRLFTHSPRMAFLVKVTPQSFEELQSRQFFFFATEYISEFKLETGWQKAGKGSFNFKYFGELKSHFSQDLKELGFGEIKISERSGIIKATGLSKDLPMAASLCWVEVVWCSPIYKYDNEGSEESVFPSPKIDAGGRALSLASRRFISGKSGWGGAGVNIGIIDKRLYEGGPLSGEILANSHTEGTNSPETNHGCSMSFLMAGKRDVQNSCAETGDVLEGMAPLAKILFRSSEIDIDPQDSFDVFGSDPANIKLSSHSYHFENQPGAYSEKVKVFEREARNGAIILVSAGNASSTTIIPSPAIGKNVIAVAGVSFFHDQFINVGDIYAGGVEGPTSYGTLKPEIVAPAGSGSFFEFGVPSYSPTYDSNYPVYCGSTKYQKKSGVSNSAALATGAVALALPGIEAELGEFETLSSQRVRALVINTAIPLKGNDPDGLRGHANCKFGYGLINPFSCVEQLNGGYVDPYLRREIVEDHVWYGGGKVFDVNVEPIDDPGNPGLLLQPEKISIALVYNDIDELVSDDRLLVNSKRTGNCTYL